MGGSARNVAGILAGVSREVRMRRVVVTGAGGFVGHHLVTALRSSGCWVRGVDRKYPEFTRVDADEFEIRDLRHFDECLEAMRDVDEVFALAADMGGMGFISTHHASLFRDNALINLHSLEAARQQGVRRYLISSSACVYPEHLQQDAQAIPLKEDDAYPANPQDAYGWEKLFAERLCHYFFAEYDLDVRIVRFHNVYGPYGTFQGGREKVPAALCRKVAEAAPDGEIVVWGDGGQVRSFCYIDDCIVGIQRIMDADERGPINLGSDRLVTIDELAQLIIRISGKDGLKLAHVPGPEGVRGRNSDNSRIRDVLGWAPATPLEDGLARTYSWIAEQVEAARVQRACRDPVKFAGPLA